MQEYETYDWSVGTEEAHLEMVRHGSHEQLRALARSYDWSKHPERVLGWVMAQKCIDLGTALAVFLNGEPERFNYMPKRDVPSGYRSAARLLDNICLRLNSGYYLVYPELPVSHVKRLNKWIAFQKADRAEGRRGRWILDEEIIAPLFNGALHIEGEAAIFKSKRNSLLLDILSPVIDLATKRVIDDPITPAETSQRRRG